MTRECSMLRLRAESMACGLQVNRVEKIASLYHTTRSERQRVPLIRREVSICFRRLWASATTPPARGGTQRTISSTKRRAQTLILESPTRPSCNI